MQEICRSIGVYGVAANNANKHTTQADAETRSLTPTHAAVASETATLRVYPYHAWKWYGLTVAQYIWSTGRKTKVQPNKASNNKRNTQGREGGGVIPENLRKHKLTVPQQEREDIQRRPAGKQRHSVQLRNGAMHERGAKDERNDQRAVRQLPTRKQGSRG